MFTNRSGRWKSPSPDRRTGLCQSGKGPAGLPGCCPGGYPLPCGGTKDGGWVIGSMAVVGTADKLFALQGVLSIEAPMKHGGCGGRGIGSMAVAEAGPPRAAAPTGVLSIGTQMRKEGIQADSLTGPATAEREIRQVDTHQPPFDYAAGKSFLASASHSGAPPYRSPVLLFLFWAVQSTSHLHG